MTTKTTAPAARYQLTDADRAYHAAMDAAAPDHVWHDDDRPVAACVLCHPVLLLR